MRSDLQDQYAFDGEERKGGLGHESIDVTDTAWHKYRAMGGSGGM